MMNLLKFQYFLLFLLPLAIVIQRLDVLPFRATFSLFGIALLLITLIALIGLGGLLWSFVKNRAGLRGTAIRMLIVGLLPAATILAVVGPANLQQPVIHDITTDTQDPPPFVAAARARVEGENSTEYDADNIAALQLAAYPDINPLNSGLTPAMAFEKSLEVVESFGWQVLDSDVNAGVIEAVEETRLFGFKDDVVIRIRPNGVGSRIDLRSNSRVGGGDLGANAARIKRFIAAYGPQ